MDYDIPRVVSYKIQYVYMVKRFKEKEIVKYRAISLYWNYKENILEYDLIITLDEYLSGIWSC